eukprot:gene5288-6130_t
MCSFDLFGFGRAHPNLYCTILCLPHQKMKSHNGLFKHVHDSMNPEENASIFSILTFTFMQPLMRIGLTKPLEMSDLYPINKRDKSSNVFEKFEEYWPINFAQDKTAPYYHGLIYSGILLLAYLVSGFCYAYWDYRVTISAYNARTALISAIYKKSLLVSNSVRNKGNKGKGNTINLASIDVDVIVNNIQYFHFVFSVPLQMIASFIMLFKLLKWGALIGFGSLLIFIPMNAVAAMKQASLNERVMSRKDIRTSAVTEAINSIRVLKFYGWIGLMYDKIMKLRGDEVREIKKLNVVTAFLYLFWFLTPDFVTVTAFSSYALFGNALDTSTIITALSIFFILRFPLSILPHLISGITMAKVSLNRIEAFLLNEELVKPDTNLSGVRQFGPIDPDFEASNSAVSINNASFQWTYLVDGDEEEDDGAKEKEKDKIDINQGFDPLVMDVKEEKEDPVILRDITLDIPMGSLTILVGPVGSGKSSVLSAVLGDMKMLSGHLALRGTVAYVSQLPWIMNGSLRENILFGTPYDESRYQNILEICCLLQDIETLPAGDKSEIGEKGINLSGGQKMRLSLARAIYSNADLYLFDDPLASLDANVAIEVFHGAIKPLTTSGKTVVLATHQVFPLEHSDQIVTIADGVITRVGQYDPELRATWETYQLAAHQKPEEPKEEEDDDDDDEDGDIVVDEDRKVGKVQFKDYMTYFRMVGGFYIFLSFSLSIVSPTLSVFGNYWLSRWSEEWQNKDHPTLFFYLGIYFLSAVGMSAGIFFMTLVNTFGGLAASQRFHRSALDSVLKSPVQFYDQNPSGRIINRFSKDVSNLDFTLPLSLGEVIFYFIWRWYLGNARELQRLSSISMSPILTHFSETLYGIQVIRAFSAGGRFLDEMMNRLDANTSAETSQAFVTHWATLRLSLVCSLFVTTAALSATFLREYISPALIGLAISYSVTLTGELNWMMVQLTQVETQMNSVERINHYCHLTKEAPCKRPDNQVPPSWPARGEIIFLNYSMSYRPDLPPSISNIDLVIQPGSKVGICGRTGAGKSSLLLCLFRLVEGSSGSIVIDGYDISQIGLQDLRSKMSIIPQDPTLFSGTLRYNLDPFNLFLDSEIWDILERVHLKDKIKSLDTQVSEDGSNFSVGQAQLLSMARALLRKSKIIVLDEATASVDMETDEIIQTTIRTEFKDSTVITIAHRLNTIKDYDVTVLMSDGRIQQVDKVTLYKIKETSISFS